MDVRKLISVQADSIYVATIADYVQKEGVYFDVTYCVRTSWYILDFFETLNRMFEMIKSGRQLYLI